MIKIIFLSAVRSLLKYKQISLINILGLVFGFTSFLFTIHYIIYEFSFDSFIPKSENVYRINLELKKEGETIYKGAKSPRGLYFAIQNEIPEVQANGVAYFEKCLVSFEEINFANQDVLWVSEDFENVFPLEMIEGVADYSRPRTGTISETAAKALFRNQNPIGKIMKVNQGMPIEITGIFKDLPSNTHLTAQYFASIKTWVEMEAIGEQGDWRWNGWWNYIRLHDDASPKQTIAKINAFPNTYMSFLRDDNREGIFELQALNDLHYLKGIEGEMGATTNFSSLINLIIIALITLLIAWINYVNLSTAHTQTRSIQIKMRKLIGASNMHIWHQSLAESIILNLAAFLISFTFYLLFLNTFADIFNIPLKHAYVPMGKIFLILGSVVTLGILFSSMYYAIDLARTNFVSKQNNFKGGHFKKGLVVVQMALSIVFLISTIMVYKQISYMKNKNLGIELDGVVICNGPASLNADGNKRQKYQGFKNELLTYAGFESATFNLFVPGMEPSGLGYSEFHNPSKGAMPGVLFFENNADHGYFQTYQLNLLAGRSFSENPAQNSNKVILNQTSMNLLGFNDTEEAIGQTIYRKGNDTTRLEIIGVVADFHNEGLQKPIYPMVWNNFYPREFGYISIRVNSKSPQEIVSQLKTVWDKHYPKDNLDFVFADELFNLQYESESRYSKFYIWLTLLSIGIATLGLYGLIIFYLGKRNKEISLRKVNGASVAEIILLLNTDFIRWVVISVIIAFPVAWYAMNNWLINFAYKTNLSWWIFFLSGMLILTIVILTVTLQSWRIATRNPVEALRYE